jgi:hypothetical protein
VGFDWIDQKNAAMVAAALVIAIAIALCFSVFLPLRIPPSLLTLSLPLYKFLFTQMPFSSNPNPKLKKP